MTYQFIRVIIYVPLNSSPQVMVKQIMVTCKKTLQNVISHRTVRLIYFNIKRGHINMKQDTMILEYDIFHFLLYVKIKNEHHIWQLLPHSRYSRDQTWASNCLAGPQSTKINYTGPK